MLVEDRFPVVWQPSVENDHVRQLLLHRCRLVRMRTRIKNQLDSMQERRVIEFQVWSPKRRGEIERYRCRLVCAPGARSSGSAGRVGQAESSLGRGGAEAAKTTRRPVC